MVQSYEKSIRVAKECIDNANIVSSPELIAIQSIMEEETPNQKEFCKLVRSAAEMHGLLIEAANLCCKRDKSFKDVTDIANVYGLYPTYSLLVSIFIDKTFSQSNKERGIIQYSRNCGIVCAQLSYWLHEITPLEAYLIGFMHSVGNLVAIRVLENYGELFNKQIIYPFSANAEEYERYGTSHSIIGALLTKRWRLNSLVTKSILLHHDKNYLIKTEKNPNLSGLVSMIMLANFLVTSHEFVEIMTAELLEYRDLALEGLSHIPQKQAIKAALSALDKFGGECLLFMPESAI